MVWGSFFICLYILKTFISLMLLTFIMSYSINSLVNFLRSKFSWPRWGIILVVYGVLGILMLGVGMIVIPNVYHEGQTLSREIPQVLLREIPKAKEKLPEQLQVLVNSPEFSKFIEGLDLENTVRENFGDILQAVTVFFRDLLRISFYLILSMIFSFLILWDLERLKRDVKSLRDTRLQGVYHTITPHLVRLSDILGKAFEAQIVIAFANTVLTLIGLTFLGIPSKLFLSVFVFLCSFIPVLGVFISTIPICLVRKNFKSPLDQRLIPCYCTFRDWGVV
ncbi:AI-2E family transporter [bacterium]|nr:AI-2E family transporter [bacterium]